MTPTLVSAPLAALVTWLVSRATTAPDDVERQWLVLHGTAADRYAERLARLTIAGPGSAPGRPGRRRRRDADR